MEWINYIGDMFKMVSFLFLSIFTSYYNYAFDTTGGFGCKKDTTVKEHILLGPYSKTTIFIPNSYFGSSNTYKLSIERKKIDDIHLEVKQEDMSPACLSEDYETSGTDRSKMFSRITLRGFSSEMAESRYKHNKYDYSVYVAKHSLGFDVFTREEDIRNKNSRGKRLFLTSSDKYFTKPSWVICRALRKKYSPTNEDIMNCTMHTMYNEHLFLEYAIHGADLKNLKPFDKKVRAFVKSIIKEQSYFDLDKMVSIDERVCAGTVKAKIANVNLNMPRSLSYRLTGNKIPHGKESPKYGCDIKSIDNIASIRLTKYPSSESASISVPHEKSETTYDQYGRTTQSIFDAGRYEKLDGGYYRYSLQHIQAERYLIPNEVLKTGNQQPIIIECKGKEKNRDSFYRENCYSKYIHPSGLFVSHLYDRRNKKPYSVFETIKEKYETIDEMIVKAE